MPAAAPVHAQRFAAGADLLVPFHFDLPLEPIEVGGALVFVGHDMQTRASRSLRVTGATATAAPGLDGLDRVAGATACGGARWLVTAASHPGQGFLEWTVRDERARAVWSSPRGATDVALQCPAGTLVVGYATYVADAELVTQTLAPRRGPVRRVASGPHGLVPAIRWISRTPDEIFVATTDPETGTAELMRVARATITHRRPLTRWTLPLLAIIGDAVLVAEDREGRLIALDHRDLTTASEIVVADDGQLNALRAGPRGVVAVLTDDALPRGARGLERPQRPVHVSADGRRQSVDDRHMRTLRLWTPRARALGDPIDLGTAMTVTGWLGDAFYVWQASEEDPATGRRTSTRLRRFALVD